MPGLKRERKGGRITMKKFFYDMDGTLTEWREIADEKELYRKNYFLSLRPNEAVIESARKLSAAGEEVYILSCVLTDSRYAREEKESWLRKYVPFIPEERWIFVPYGESKPRYLTKRLGIAELTPGEVLIDDYSENLRDWSANNGLAVKVMNGRNGTKGTWKGLRVEAENASDILRILLKEAAA